MCLDVGIGATVYHPINSSDGNTCLSSWTVRTVTSDQGWLRRTLIPPMCKERMVDSMTISFDGKFECVDDIDLSAVLRS